MEELTFQIEFISPLLIHGSNPREADPLGLTGKALRGAWRFWFRALVGGMVPHITPAKLAELEGEIFGSADEKVGATFRLQVIKQFGVKTTGKPELPHPYLGFKEKDRSGNKTHKDATSQGYAIGAKFAITIRRRPQLNMDHDQWRNVLLSTIWVWGNLGSVGARARRGFGSPLLKPLGDCNPFTLVKMDTLRYGVTFTTVDELRKHLGNGMLAARKIFSSYLKVNPENTNQPFSNFFTLRHIGQIAVADSGESDINLLIHKVHGSSECRGIGYAGKNTRMSSPVYLRFHKVGDELFPVATCSRKHAQCNSHQNCITEYLRQAGCSTWLNDKPLEEATHANIRR